MFHDKGKVPIHLAAAKLARILESDNYVLTAKDKTESTRKAAASAGQFQFAARSISKQSSARVKRDEPATALPFCSSLQAIQSLASIVFDLVKRNGNQQGQ
jgi:hypothetical protein